MRDREVEVKPHGAIRSAGFLPVSFFSAFMDSAPNSTNSAVYIHREAGPSQITDIRPELFRRWLSASHADPRTTRLYDRGSRGISREDSILMAMLLSRKGCKLDAS